MTALLRTLLLLSLALTASAALANTAGPDRIQPGEVLRAKFVQIRQLTGLSRAVKSEGEMIYAPDRGIVWRVASPLASTTVFGKGGFLQIVGDQPASRLSAEQVPALSRFYEILSAALSGDRAALAQEFDFRNETVGPPWSLLLEPRTGTSGASPSIQRIELRGNRFVEQVKLTRPGGDHDQIEFSEASVSRQPPSAEELRLFERLQAQ